MTYYGWATIICGKFGRYRLYIEWNLTYIFPYFPIINKSTTKIEARCLSGKKVVYEQKKNTIFSKYTNL